MTFDEYQKQAASFCRYKAADKLPFYCLGLGGETGEVLEKVKKMFRDNGGIPSVAHVESMRYELGDVLWYLSRIADAYGITLSEVAEANINKLTDRKSRNAIHGSGDNR